MAIPPSLEGSGGHFGTAVSTSGVIVSGSSRGLVSLLRGRFGVLTVVAATSLAISVPLAFWLRRNRSAKRVDWDDVIAKTVQEKEVNETRAQKDAIVEEKNQADPEALKNFSHSSWCDIVDEEKAEEEVLEANDMAAKFDDKKLSSKLEALNIEESHENKEDHPQGKNIIESNKKRTDSGMASPSMTESSKAQNESNGNDASRASVCSDDLDCASSSSSNQHQTRDGANSIDAAAVGSDSGQGSEADDNMLMTYQFYVPGHLCGKFIGAGGQHVKHLKAKSNCKVNINSFGEPNKRKKSNKDHSQSEVQLCSIVGTRSGIDKCLELIREKFPQDKYPELQLDQCNPPNELGYYGEETLSPQLGLAFGLTHQVVVSAIVSGGQIFIQQPNHPTYSYLLRLSNCMNHVYDSTKSSKAPEIPRPAPVGLVCVAPFGDQWFRVQVVAYDAISDCCDVKFLDVGGYSNYQASDLKQIRSDFMSLPFQAIECYLANVIPADGVQWSLESITVLEKLVENKPLAANMIGYAEDMTPMIQLYVCTNSSGSDETAQAKEADQILVNRELVEQGVAAWVEPEPLPAFEEAQLAEPVPAEMVPDMNVATEDSQTTY